MDREELRSELNKSLGSTQTHLTLSDETINGELDDVLSHELDESGALPDGAMERLVGRLVRMDGNLHKDVSNEVAKLRKDRRKDSRKDADKDAGKDADGDGRGKDNHAGEGGKGGNDKPKDADEPEWARKLSERLEAIEQHQKARDEREAKDAKISAVKEGLSERLRKAGVSVNGYVLAHAIKDMESEQDMEADESHLVDSAERLYYGGLKEAGLSGKGAIPSSHSGLGGKHGNDYVDGYFKRKAAKEGWGAKK